MKIKKLRRILTLMLLLLSMSLTALAQPETPEAIEMLYNGKTGEQHAQDFGSVSKGPEEEDKADIIVSLQIDNPIMEINGVETEIDAGRGTTPVVTNGRTLVPIRAIIEAFGGTVGWEESSQTVLLTLKDDRIQLGIEKTVAYINDTEERLDVAPCILNGRTMLPIRFIAEGFNLGVAWEGDTQTVSIIRNALDYAEYTALMGAVPPYAGQAYTQINHNTPFFKEYEIIHGSFEYYSDLDALGRCDVCFASIATDLMPTEERESIGAITPTGWINAKYDTVEGGYLYNRCHLIGYQLTGENANERNLITGTRYMNIDGMLPFENLIDDYIESTGNRVLYRVTPVFKENNLVADGVLLEAYSVEDKGQGITFCVYCYNVQPTITIDYLTGESRLEGDTSKTEGDIPLVPDTAGEENSSSRVYRTPSGTKYHLDAQCGGQNSFSVAITEALQRGLTPCAICAI